ncbi:MAG TPA: ATP-binding protein, partial [Phycisphaerales bacterium]|nr:ATP-binding protein [Phycisphaerales bacterium]
NLDGIVQDVLAFAREGKLKPTKTTSRDVIEQALESCAGVLAANTARVVRSDDTAFEFEGDTSLLAQAAANVIRNAAEAVKEAHRDDVKARVIRIGAERKRMRRPAGGNGMYVVVWVEDTGKGIPAEARERIFSPFFTTRAQGTGLGLAIVHRIVDAHGGHVLVSNRKGGGTKFELCLPTPLTSGALVSEGGRGASRQGRLDQHIEVKRAGRGAGRDLENPEWSEA